MARRTVVQMLPALALGTLFLVSCCAHAQEAAEAGTYDVNAEMQKLQQWKDYLSSELDKCKADAEQTRTALQGEQHRAAEYGSQVAQLTQAASDAQARATTAEASASQAATRVAEAEALATSHSQYSEQLAAQIEQLKQEVAAATAKAADAESKASAHAASANAANGEAAALRKQLADAVSERQALESRVAELASATAKAGGLHDHALAIFNILVDEAARHKDTALNYANEKLPGFKAKVAEAHDVVTAYMPNVTGFVNQVDGELRPWLRQSLTSVPALKQYGEDPVVLQAVVYAILGAPLLMLLPALSCCYRLVGRRPASSSGPAAKPSRRNKQRRG